MREGGKEGQAGQSKREAGAEFLLCSCDVYRTGPILLLPQYCLCGESLCLRNVKTLYYVALPQFLSAMCLGAEDLCRYDVMFLGACYAMGACVHKTFHVWGLKAGVQVMFYLTAEGL